MYTFDIPAELTMTHASAATLRLSPTDEIAVALKDLQPGDALTPQPGAARSAVPFGHKVALQPIARGAVIHRLGQPSASPRRTSAREHVHLHNMGFEASMAGRAIGTRLSNAPLLPPADIPTFDGFRRADGKAGTRNYVGVLTTVNCSALVARMIADHFRDPRHLAAFPGVDGVVALTHKSGCSIAEGGKSMGMLRRTLGGYARHPNFSGILIVGLGCEDNQIDRLLAASAWSRAEPQNPSDAGDGRHALERAGRHRGGGGDAARSLQGAPRADPGSEIVVGLQCGGSDSFSGISANPALGAAVDRLVACGGTAILAETPEIYGAENLLLERAISREVGEKLIGLLEWWEKYTAGEPEGFDNNPSPGNKAGGLTTILEKSLGAVAKGGTTNLVEVYGYAAPVDAAASSSWIRPASTLSPPPVRWRAAPTSSASPPAAAPATAAARRPR